MLRVILPLLMPLVLVAMTAPAQELQPTAGPSSAPRPSSCPMICSRSPSRRSRHNLKDRR